MSLHECCGVVYTITSMANLEVVCSDDGDVGGYRDEMKMVAAWVGEWLMVCG